ncbi:hypothetical protein LFYK43_11050 [Ligilactobacillus salitolerans]|uniref:DUF3168 domain-containing protein n=1 Tax=Ligilactobacillus salitolerans TaxID=1808352 RepID=A0A401ISZ4_9LACO|nr:DUF3168 domain-containing protein [Ligilactobacillus salitolerans]GBG94646.1 hypothetical protein LFYK43_11050 [Ligilactobacillus salitolerans]
MISPQKCLFDYYFKLIQEKGFPVYDYLPLKDEPVTYPFVVLSQTQTVNYDTKYSRNDHIFLTIDVWGGRKQRKVVGEIADGLFNSAIGVVKTDVYTFYGQQNQQNLQMMIDTSVSNTVYQRANLTLELTVN